MEAHSPPSRSTAQISLLGAVPFSCFYIVQATRIVHTFIIKMMMCIRVRKRVHSRMLDNSAFPTFIASPAHMQKPLIRNFSTRNVHIISSAFTPYEESPKRGTWQQRQHAPNHPMRRSPFLGSLFFLVSPPDFLTLKRHTAKYEGL